MYKAKSTGQLLQKHSLNTADHSLLVSLQNTVWHYNIMDSSRLSNALETSASETHYDGQFTLSTQLVKPNYFVIPTKVSLETYPVD